jgi:hypothetical protein
MPHGPMNIKRQLYLLTRPSRGLTPKQTINFKFTCTRRLELSTDRLLEWAHSCWKQWRVSSLLYRACCMLFQSLLYCTNSCTSLHLKTLKSHTKTLKIRPYMFRPPLKRSTAMDPLRMFSEETEFHCQIPRGSVSLLWKLLGRTRSSNTLASSYLLTYLLTYSVEQSLS